ncbi:hypothetical protein [Mucilaginibacter pedocola]|nr:hypothetical protein [Mucilaginibacter pedocola]
MEFHWFKEILKDMALSTELNDRPTVLKFRHTDLSHIDFDYYQRYVLHQCPERETTRGIYEQLLVKFQNKKTGESSAGGEKEFQAQAQLVNQCNWLLLVGSYRYDK